MGLGDLLYGAMDFLEKSSARVERTAERNARQNLTNATREYNSNDRDSIDRYNQARKQYSDLNYTMTKNDEIRADYNAQKRYKSATSTRDIEYAEYKQKQDYRQIDRNVEMRNQRLRDSDEKISRR